MSLDQYFQTIRHLKPIQIYSRLKFQLAPPNPKQTPPPLRPRSAPWQPPAEHPPSQTGPSTFRFLNTERTITAWDDERIPRLWRYNLHYFDDLNAASSAGRRAWHTALLARWIAENPPAKGSGWEPYPASLRIVNWIKWSLGGAELSPESIDSLASQIRFLLCRLEWHLLANHLFANAKALLFAGAFFSGPEAEHWKSEGLRILNREIPEQILADGGHIERSPMYHAVILEDMLDLVNLARAYPQAFPEQTVCTWAEHAGRMIAWMDAMCHPDGEISFFNDAAIGIAASPETLRRYAGQLGISASKTVLGASGYVRLESGDTVVLFDAAPIGPDYQPGHAHNDTLSFELSHRGRRVLVNSGTSTYDLGTERTWERSTPAHNTVAVDGMDQSETWGAFRVARRARVIDARAEERAVEAAHNGYSRLPNPVVHRRRLELTPGRVVITDSLEGGGDHQVDLFFHLHPEAGSLAEIRLDPAMECSVEAGLYRPQFGVRQPNQTVRGRWRGPCPHTFVTTIDLT